MCITDLIDDLYSVLRLSVLKTIVDAVTGELIEVEESNELIEKKLYEVQAIDQETFEMLAMFQYYEDQYELFKYKLKQAFKENGIKKWETEQFTATFKDEQLQFRVDTDRLKEDGLYDKYLKAVPVKESLQIRFKKGK